MVSEAIAAGDVNAINYFLGQEYITAFKALASSPQQRTVIVPAEFAGIAGAIEGIGALTGFSKPGGKPGNASDDTPRGTTGPWSKS